MSTFTYSSNIPNPSNDPADDVSVMQSNAGSISSIVAVDHVGFNVSGGGQHKQITFNSNNVPAVPASPPVLFTNNDASSLPQLFFYSGNATRSSSQYVASGNGSVLVMGGIILKWGSYTIINNNTTQAVSFTSAFPNNVYSLVISPSSTINTTQNFYYTNLTTSGFTGNRGSTAVSQTYTYIAIGN